MFCQLVKINIQLNLTTLSTEARYLGVTIQSDFKWNSHVNNISHKANNTLGFLKRNLNINSISVKEQAYKTLVRPTLEYACSVWDSYFTEDINKLEKVQRRAARYVTGRNNNTSSVSDMLQNLHCTVEKPGRRQTDGLETNNDV